jgi:hypothetical protein
METKLKELQETILYFIQEKENRDLSKIEKENFLNSQLNFNRLLKHEDAEIIELP